MRRRARTDNNQRHVVAALEAIGCTVALLHMVGAGVPDLLVGWRGATYLIEVKNPDTGYGRKGLNRLQSTWSAKWRGGKVYVVRSVAEALALFGVTGPIPTSKAA